MKTIKICLLSLLSLTTVLTTTALMNAAKANEDWTYLNCKGEYNFTNRNTGKIATVAIAVNMGKVKYSTDWQDSSNFIIGSTGGYGQAYVKRDLDNRVGGYNIYYIDDNGDQQEYSSHKLVGDKDIFTFTVNKGASYALNDNGTAHCDRVTPASFKANFKKLTGTNINITLNGPSL